MNTKLVSENALTVIDQYLNFRIGNANCPIPYFNNRNLGLKGQMRARVGKGSPKDIFDELQDIFILEKIDSKTLDSTSLQKILVEKNIGIDCSGFAYYVLNAESEARGKGTLDKHLSFPFSSGIMGKIRAKLRPVENVGVATLAHNDNSKVLNITQAEPGDMITMLGPENESRGDPQRNHILIIHQVEYQNFMPTTLHYSHSISWPSDGEYSHGVRQGKIEITNPIVPLTDQRWIETEKTGAENYTFAKAQKSTTELRRLNYF